MRITLSERGTPDWQTAADLARLVFAKQYQASISPDPDGFLAFFETAADGQEEVLACAGLSFPEEESILLERYLDAPVEDVITRAVGAPSNAPRSCRSAPSPRYGPPPAPRSSRRSR